MTESQDVKQRAEFNMALSYLARLNSFFYAADMACYQRDMNGWFNALIILYRELSTEIDTGKRDEFDKRMMDINNQLYKTQRTMNGRGIQPDLYMKLHKFEQDLRDITKEAGLQMKMTDDATNALM
jgi:hypothetical protein